jgi:hypothetical protein
VGAIAPPESLARAPAAKDRPYRQVAILSLEKVSLQNQENLQIVYNIVYNLEVFTTSNPLKK